MPDGDIKYITESEDRKRIIYEFDPSSSFLIEQKDEFDGGWGSSLARAKNLKTKSKYPVMYVPWDDQK
jgi:hypothetical protein